MKRFVTPKQPDTPPSQTPETAPASPPLLEHKFHDINLDSLLNRHLQLLYLETRQLEAEARAGKLPKDSAYAMRENLKLIMELKKKEKELLDNLTDDDITKMIEEKLSEQDKKSR